MEIEQALYATLSTATLTTSLGSTNIFPMIRPQDSTLPAVTYQQISQPWVRAMGTDPGLRYPRYQIDSWSTSFAQAKTVAKKVRTVLADYSGNLGGSVPVQRIFFDGETDLLDVDEEKNVPIYHIVQDYIIWHTS